MSTAEELLRQAAENGAAATDIKPYLTVDLYGRQIIIPNSIKNIGVESDDEVTRLYFKVPRYFDEVDLSEFRARINYTNANDEEDCYTPTDVEVMDEYITFSWLVGRFACASEGSVEFNVCMVDYYDDGVTIDREFNTTPSTLPVLKGKETVPAIVEKERDAMAAVAKQAAEEALAEFDIDDTDVDINLPYIDEDTHMWMVWDAEAGMYVDSGVSAEGKGEPGPAGPAGPAGASGLPNVVNDYFSGLYSMPWYSEVHAIEPATYVDFDGFLRNREHPNVNMWSVIFTAAEGITVTVPDYVEWAVAEPMFTAGYTYYLSFIPLIDESSEIDSYFSGKILGIWVAKELS